MKLSERLYKAASLIPDGAKFADIGTDHGYVPVWLAIRGGAKRIVASDINAGPLNAAKINAEKYGVSDKIEFVLADGLDGINGDVDTVLIAGMGGETIMAILQNAPWLRDSGALLILQPQSKRRELTAWLYANGYTIEDASLVKDGGRIYTVLSVRAGENGERAAADTLILDILVSKRDSLVSEFLDILIKKYSAAVDGMKKSNSDNAETEEYFLSALKRLKTISKKEAENAEFY